MTTNNWPGFECSHKLKSVTIKNKPLENNQPVSSLELNLKEPHLPNRTRSLHIHKIKDRRLNASTWKHCQPVLSFNYILVVRY